MMYDKSGNHYFFFKLVHLLAFGILFLLQLQVKYIDASNKKTEYHAKTVQHYNHQIKNYEDSNAQTILVNKRFEISAAIVLLLPLILALVIEFISFDFPKFVNAAIRKFNFHSYFLRRGPPVLLSL